MPSSCFEPSGSIHASVSDASVVSRHTASIDETDAATMNPPDSKTPTCHRRLPADPAILAWVAVALLALVPLEHAVASIVAHVPQRSARVQPATPAAATQPDDQPARAEGTSTP